MTVSKEYDEAVAELNRHLSESERPEYAAYCAGLDSSPGIAVVRAWTIMRVASRGGPGFAFRASLAELAELQQLVGGEEPYAAEIAKVVEMVRLGAAAHENDLATFQQVAERFPPQPR